jgi:predicted enzyme related to lactoylglutathione lyase/quinol monooxygenase YgiN
MFADAVSLTSQWYLNPGHEADGWAALEALVAAVHAEEPDTLTYLVHAPSPAALTSRPPMSATEVLFFEVYRDADAFRRHLTGPVFTRFVAQHGALFVNADGSPWTTVRFLQRRAGFVRTEAERRVCAGNAHPAVMFEVLAANQAEALAFYRAVFGWETVTGTGGFAYVPFPGTSPRLLGGVGQADPSVQGYERGAYFYLQVDDLEATLAKVVAAGGQVYVEPAAVDGYDFAMFRDPEGQVVGLITPVPAGGPTPTSRSAPSEARARATR